MSTIAEIELIELVAKVLSQSADVILYLAHEASHSALLVSQQRPKERETFSSVFLVCLFLFIKV